MPTAHAAYLWPGQTHFGFGAAARTGSEARALGATHAFLLADPGVVAAGVVEPVLHSLAAAGLTWTLYDKVIPNPSADSVDRSAEAWRASGADIVIAVGGGSAMDTGKGLRMLAAYPGRSIAAYSFLRGEDALPPPPSFLMPPLLALPTTAGTGAEVTPWGVITDTARQQKFGIGGPQVTPTVALCDPALTLGLPPYLTAATGMDALTHLIEAYVSTNHNPILDPVILYGIELVGRSLPVAVAKGANETARDEVMQGALIGGIAISSKWLGACHALAHPLSAMAEVQHGVANAIMLPHQMAHSLSSAPERYARIGAALEPHTAAAPGDPAERAVAAVERLLRACSLPTRLRDVGVPQEILPELGAAAILDLNWLTNPRPVTQPMLEALYRQAW